MFKYDPTISNNVLRELEEAEMQAKETARIIYELKERVAELVKVKQKNLSLKLQNMQRVMIFFTERENDGS